MPVIENEGLHFYYEEYGSGAPVVFLHGFTLDRRMWAAQAEYFSSDYRVILMDARGHGKSDAPPTGYSRTDRVEDVRRLVDKLKIDKFHLVGLSMGGVTGIGFALKYQERLKSLTLASTGVAGYRVSKKFDKLDRMAREEGLEAVRKKWMAMSLIWFKDRNEEIGKLMQTMVDEHSGAVWMDPMRGKYSRTKDFDHVHKITVPTNIMSGKMDKVFVPLAKKLHEKIESSSLTVYDDVGHMINLEIPDRFNEDLKRFITSVESVK